MSELKPYSPLAAKFKNFSPKSSMSAFEEFEKRGNQRRRKLIFLFITLFSTGLAALFLIQGTRHSAPTFTDSKENSVITGTHEAREQKISDRNNNVLVEDEIKKEQAVAIRAPEFVESEHKTDMVHLFDYISVKGIRWDELPFDRIDPFRPEKLKTPSPKIVKDPDLRQAPLWAVGISAGPVLSWQTVAAASNASEYVHEDYGNQRNNAKKASMGFQTSVMFSYSGFRMLQLSAGLSVEQYVNNDHYEFELNKVPVYDIDNTIAGYIELGDTGSIDVNRKAVQRYTYLTFPIGINKSIYIAKGWNLEINPSIRCGFLLSAKGDILDERDISETISLLEIDHSLFNPGYSMRLAIGKQLNDKCRLSLSSQYMSMIKPLSKDTYYNTKNHGLDFNITLSYALSQ